MSEYDVELFLEPWISVGCSENDSLELSEMVGESETDSFVEFWLREGPSELVSSDRLWTPEGVVDISNLELSKLVGEIDVDLPVKFWLDEGFNENEELELSEIVGKNDVELSEGL